MDLKKIRKLQKTAMKKKENRELREDSTKKEVTADLYKRRIKGELKEILEALEKKVEESANLGYTTTEHRHRLKSFEDISCIVEGDEWINYLEKIGELIQNSFPSEIKVTYKHTFTEYMTARQRPNESDRDFQYRKYCSYKDNFGFYKKNLEIEFSIDFTPEGQESDV